MQITHIVDNDFVIHKITGKFSGKASGWYHNGELFGAEQILPSGVVRNVKRGTKLWKYISGKKVYGQSKLK